MACHVLVENYMSHMQPVGMNQKLPYDKSTAVM